MYGTAAVEALGVGKCNHAPCLLMQAEEENLREQALQATCAALRGLSITGRANCLFPQVWIKTQKSDQQIIKFRSNNLNIMLSRNSRENLKEAERERRKEGKKEGRKEGRLSWFIMFLFCQRVLSCFMFSCGSMQLFIILITFHVNHMSSLYRFHQLSITFRHMSPLRVWLSGLLFRNLGPGAA